jgi:hypothetical protein
MAARVAPASSSPPPNDGPLPRATSIFDLDGDGDVDIFDGFFALYLLISKSLHALDLYFVGFPVISTVCTVCSFVALSFQIGGVAQLVEDVQDLSLLIGADLVRLNLFPTPEIDLS